MKNKIISLAIVGVLFVGLLGTSLAQAHRPNQSQASTLLESISKFTSSLTELSASAINALPDKSKAKEIIQTIQIQTEALKAVIDQVKVQQLTQTLRPGNAGEDVKIVQEYLASQDNIYQEKLVTGYYGSLTEQAVKNFQEKAGLKSDGVIGSKTRKVINQDLLEETVTNITIPLALNLQQYTIVLLNIANELKLVPVGKRAVIAKRLAEYTKMRKELVLKTMKTDPEKVFRNALPSSALSGVSGDVLNLVEQRKQVRGKFEYIHIHMGDFETGTTEDQFYVTESDTNKRYRVYAKGIPQAITDDIVTIDGAILDDQIATVDTSIVVNSRSAAVTVASKKLSLSDKIINSFRPKTADAQTYLVQKKTLVIMVNFDTDTRTPWTESQVRGTYFTDPNSSNNYYKENSFGTMELIGKLRADGDVYGWVTVPSAGAFTCDYYSWAKAADAAVQAQGVDLTGYNLKSYLLVSAPGCGWGGLANLGGNPALSWNNGLRLGTITHEFGHNFGIHHASSWSCIENGVRVSVSADTNCIRGEYGDPYDVMGSSGGIRHMNNYHKGRTSTNWLAPANTQTIDRNVSPDSTYTITHIEQASGGVQALRIPRAISSTGAIIDYYYIEFRQPFGFDQTISAFATNGASIRIASGYTTLLQSRLVDTTPGTTGFLDAPLAVGKTFSDTQRGINVTTLGVSSTGASVRVSFGPLPCIRANPALSLSPSSVSVFAGQSASFSYTLTNNDTTSCPTSDFSITPTLPAGFAQTPSSITHLLVGGASVSGSLIVSSPSDASASSYSITETAQNILLSSYRSTALLTMTVLMPDTTPPVVTITRPADGTIVSKGNLKIGTSASDTSGIAQIIVFLNGVVLKTCYGTTSCPANVSVASLSVGAHTITTEATDKGGPVANTSSTSITITKK